MHISSEAEDGTGEPVSLDADIYYPDGDGPFPVLLMRQPYGRAIASTVVYAHPTWYASHGYIVVIQDVRGRGTSSGEFLLFHHEQTDGYASVLWAAQLPQSNGKVGMYGFSYQGMTQLYAAASRPTPLKTIAPAMVGYDLYADWAYENGALLLQAGLGWALQLAAETARLNGERNSYHTLRRAAQNLPLDDANPACPQILKELAPDSFFHDWLANPYSQADYWQQLMPDLMGVDLPMLHIGGWYDPYLRGDLRLYRQMLEQSQAPQHLWVGPWGHLPWSRRVGVLDFGPHANSPIDQLQLRWFNQFLKGQDTGLLQESPVQLFEIGPNSWQPLEHWPRDTHETLYLSSRGLAGMDQKDGRLIARLPSDPTHSQDILVHDPWRPVPSLGGHSGIPPGPFDRSSIDGRSDVLTYTAQPFEKPMQVRGEGNVILYCQADTPSFDISVVVSEVFADGRVINRTQGYYRVDRDPNDQISLIREVTIPLQPACFYIQSGNALRVSVAGACFPAYAINCGTGKTAGENQLFDCQIITIAIYHSQIYPSCLKLPLVKAV